MPFALNLAAAVEGMIDFDNQPNLKLHIREKTKLKRVNPSVAYRNSP